MHDRSRVPLIFAMQGRRWHRRRTGLHCSARPDNERRGRDRVTESVALLSRLACTLGRVLGLGAANVAANPLRRAPLRPVLHIGKKIDEALSNARWPRAASADHLPSRLRESPPSCRLLLPLPCANEWRATGDQSKGGGGEHPPCPCPCPCRHPSHGTSGATMAAAAATRWQWAPPGAQEHPARPCSPCGRHHMPPLARGSAAQPRCTKL